jgi:hypothetical protein
LPGHELRALERHDVTPGARPVPGPSAWLEATPGLRADIINFSDISSRPDRYDLPALSRPARPSSAQRQELLLDTLFPTS